MSPAKRRKRRQDFLGWLMISLSVIAVAVIAYLYQSVRSREVPLNPSDMCPQTGPHSITVVLVDATDPLSIVQKMAVEKELEDLKNGVPRYGEIELFAVTPSGHTLLNPRLTACNPGRGKEINPMYGNPTLVERRWRAVFSDRVEQLLGQLLTSAPINTSPIMESIQEIGVEVFLGQAVSQIPKELILVSDMLQNTAGFSQYHGIKSFEDFRHSAYYLKIRPSLEGVKVTIFYLRRLNAAHLQGRRHIEFWQEYFTDAGATLVHCKSIEG